MIDTTIGVPPVEDNLKYTQEELSYDHFNMPTLVHFLHMWVWQGAATVRGRGWERRGEEGGKTSVRLHSIYSLAHQPYCRTRHW